MPGAPARARLRVSSAAGPPGHRAQHLGGGHGRLAYAGQSLVDVVGVVRGGGGELGRGALRAEAVAYGELPQPGVGGEQLAQPLPGGGQRDERVVAGDRGVGVEDDEVPDLLPPAVGQEEATCDS